MYVDFAVWDLTLFYINLRLLQNTLSSWEKTVSLQSKRILIIHNTKNLGLFRFLQNINLILKYNRLQNLKKNDSNSIYLVYGVYMFWSIQ